MKKQEIYVHDDEQYVKQLQSNQHEELKESWEIKNRSTTCKTPNPRPIKKGPD